MISLFYVKNVRLILARRRVLDYNFLWFLCCLMNEYLSSSGFGILENGKSSGGMDG
jgi:hypothetical protein